jgi:hypothetical protein
MQQGSTNPELLILALVLLGFGLLIMGFITKQRIYNLLSIPGFLAIALLFDSIPIYIAMVGLTIWQFYYSFWGDL